MKQRWLEAQLAAAGDAELWQSLRRAADDSASLAWATPFPALILPVLLEEKAQEAQVRLQRQRAIRERSRAIASFAA